MKYCITLNDWIDKDLNPRVDGFAKLKKAGARIPVIRLFTNNLFELWLGNSKKFPKKIKLYLFLEFSKLLRNSFSRAVMIRQAYYIPDIPKPYGGRFSAQTPKEAVRSIENHYKFFIGQKWHTHAGHECIIFSYPRTDPPAFPELPKPSDPMPRGGMASLLETNLVEVQGTFGDHETVTAFPCDVFTVIKHADGMFEISNSKVVQKRHVLVRPDTGGKPIEQSVPEDRQLRPSLTPSEIEEATRVSIRVSEIAKTPQRVEFTYGFGPTGKLELVFNEAAKYAKPQEKDVSYKTLTGKVDFIVNTLGDSKTLIKKLKMGEDINIVYVTQHLVAAMDESALLELENTSKKLLILYPGSSSTTHRDQILRQMGHKIYLYGVRNFKIGDLVKIEINNGSAEITNLSSNYQNYIIPLEEGFLAGLENIGGKALRLSEIASQGISTPGGFIVTTKYQESMLKNSDLLDAWSKIPNKNALRSLQTSPYKVDDGFKDQVKNLLTVLGSSKPLFLRSSSLSEDDPEANFAGKYKTAESVDPTVEVVIQAYQDVVRSAFSDSVIVFSQKFGIDISRSTQIAVIIQQDVEPKQSGVAFREDPNGSGNILIEAVKGKTSGVVTGKRVPQKILCVPHTGEVTKSTGPVVLTTSQIKAIAKMATTLSGIYHHPQDIEWGFDKKSQLIVFQSRDQR